MILGFFASCKRNFCLLGRLLELDSRNFLAWAYRRQMVRLAGTPPEEEEAYSRALIDANFSNYSAWHARTSLLTEMHAARQVVSLSDLIAGPAQPSAWPSLMSV